MPKPMQKTEQRDLSLTFIKGLAVLKAFDAEHTHLSFSDIARLCDIDRAAARRLTLTLEYLGYVRRQGRAFVLTPKILILAGGFLQSHQYGKLVQPILETRSRAIDAPISLAVIDEQSAVYVAQATVDPTRVSFGFTVGSRLPLLQSAIGRALVSGLDAASRADCINTCPLEPYTSQSILDRELIAKEVEAARQSGHAIVRCEFEPRVTGLAVPLVTRGDLPFAVGTSVAEASLDDDRQAAILDTLHSSASALAGQGL